LHVRKTDDCWIYESSDRLRYPRIYLGSPESKVHIQWTTHRFSYELHFGPIPDGMGVCHTCDNTRCVRPDHLFLGTQADNMHDAVRKGRKNCWGHQKLTAENVRRLRAEYAAGGITQKALGAKYGVARNTVSQLVRGLTWTHL